jgi:hypothetical protein
MTHMFKINYIDPGTGGLLINNLFYVITVTLGIIFAFFLGTFKSIKKAISKLCQTVKNLL